jgi:6-pyruvoyl-tetrahydropterin synthase
MNFENNLKKYGEAVNDSLKDLSKEGRAAALEKKEELVTVVAQDSFTDLDTERQIFAIQKKKQDRFRKFKAFLAKTRGEHGEFIRPKIKEGVSLVAGNPEGGYFVKDANGVSVPVTYGELMTDQEWGVEYAFDESVDIHTVREYQLRQVKNELMEDLDYQIIASEANRSTNEETKRKAYRMIGERMGKDLEQAGVIAEKMVKNFLKKLSLESNGSFELLDADAFQDVENKADFIIRRKNTERAKGAQVVESDAVSHPLFEDIGIQFTTNFDKEKQLQKVKQLDKVKKRLVDMQDLVLVTLPTHEAGEHYKTWMNDKKPGGPDKLWSQETREVIFRGVMNKVLTEEEINQFCEKNFK